MSCILLYMEKLFTTSAIVKLPLDLPEAAVWSRLGRNRFLSRITPEQEVECKLSMLRALNVITPCGRWKLLKISAAGSSQVTLNETWCIESSAFAEFAAGSKYMLLGAVTVGCNIAELIARSSRIAEQAVFDAVGSECADQAIAMLMKIADNTLHRYGLTVAEKRFSVGYGGVSLAEQSRIFELLDLEAMGITLTGSFIMQPEKSVTAFAPVMSLN